MSEIWIPAAAGGGGVTSDDVTALKKHILKGERTITQDSSDEVIEGELEVNSLLSFSVAAYSGRRVLAKWQNPNQAAGKPYSGVMIRYSTSGYPGINEGTQIYKGAGNNTASGGLSQSFLDLPNLNTKYFFSIFPYVTTNKEDMIGTPINAQATTSGILNKTFTAGGSYTIPEGYSKMDAFCVGGGGGGGKGDGSKSNFYGRGGGGGGGGYTKTVKNISISGGQILNCIIGGGGGGSNTTYDGNTGGTTSITSNNKILCSANGGIGGARGERQYGGNGGSGGGRGGYDDFDGYIEHAQNGASNGGNASGQGQGSTTRVFGESSGTLYAGGGGGGGASSANYGNGGSGGGGQGGEYQKNGHNGSTNTGGGGGGGHGSNYVYAAGGNGGSGIAIIKLY